MTLILRFENRTQLIIGTMLNATLQTLSDASAENVSQTIFNKP